MSADPPFNVITFFGIMLGDDKLIDSGNDRLFAILGDTNLDFPDSNLLCSNVFVANSIESFD